MGHMVFRWAMTVSILLMVMATAESSTPEYDQCRGDSDCARGSYCNTKSDNRFCELCVECSRDYFRFPSDRTDCSKSSHECGACIDGFEEEELSLNRKRERCMPIKTSVAAPRRGGVVGRTENDSGDKKLDFLAVLVIGIVATVTVLAGVVVLGAMYWARVRKSSASTQPAAAAVALLEEGDDRGPPPPPYCFEAQEPLIVGRNQSSTNHLRQHRTRHTGTLASSLSLNLNVEEARQSKCNATPFNLRGYRDHLPVSPDSPPPIHEGALEFEGAFELEVITVDRAPSPTESVYSNATEPSQWQPEDQANVLAEPNLAHIDEEDEFEGENQTAGEGDAQVLSGVEQSQHDEVFHHDDDEEEERFLPSSSRRLHPLATDSGFLTTVSDGIGGGRDSVGVSRYASTMTLGEAPAAFSFVDSGLNLSELNQATVRSLGGAAPSRSPALLRAFSNVNMTYRSLLHRHESQEEEEGGTSGDGSGELMNKSRKRKHETESAAGGKLRFTVNQQPQAGECNSESE